MHQSIAYTGTHSSGDYGYRYVNGLGRDANYWYWTGTYLEESGSRYIKKEQLVRLNADFSFSHGIYRGYYSNATWTGLTGAAATSSDWTYDARDVSSFENNRILFLSAQDQQMYVSTNTFTGVSGGSVPAALNDSNSYPLPTVTNTDYWTTQNGWVGLAYYNSDNTCYVISHDGKLVEYTFTGEDKYYQCQTKHATSSTNFDTWLGRGVWVERFPNEVSFYESAFNNHRGYPKAVSLFENRLCFGGTLFNPNTVWLSRTNDLDNFQTGTNATEALRLTINSNTVDQIEWFTAGRELVIGTTSNEWSLGSGQGELAITPTQFNIKRRTGYGSSSIQGLLVNSTVLFFMRQNKKLREWILQDNQRDYIAADVSYIAEHITDGGTSGNIKQIALQNQPETIIWMVRADGVLVGLTYDSEQDVVAWHKHTFTGATVESVAILPNATERILYI